MTANISTYQALITSEHASKPNFMAMVGAVSQGFVDLQNFLGSLQAAFDVDEAQWTQLDMIGTRVGLTRNLGTGLPGIYTQVNPSLVPLSDADYSVLLHGKIAANSWDGTIETAYNNLQNALGPNSRLFMIDNQDMTMTIAVAGAVPDAGVEAAVSGGYMQFRPAAVYAKYAFPTAPGGPLFGFGVDNSFIGGFGHGVWANIVSP
jgi:hypothetical protein